MNIPLDTPFSVHRFLLFFSLSFPLSYEKEIHKYTLNYHIHNYSLLPFFVEGLPVHGLFKAYCNHREILFSPLLEAGL